MRSKQSLIEQSSCFSRDVREKIFQLWRRCTVPAVKHRSRPSFYQVEYLEDRTLLTAAFSEFVDPNPSADNGFGDTVVALSTGNVVITSPYADVGGTDTGAVYLFNGATGALISQLVGSTADDNLGEGGVTALTNGNYVVSSPIWDNGAATDAGAVTFGNGSTGVFGAVSAANSLVGSTGYDYVGSGGVAALTNGNYVVGSEFWGDSKGAVTFGNGSTGVLGAVSDTNSLVGSTADDFVGSGGVTALTNGNYVVRSSSWDNGAATDAGAVTFGNGSTGMNGEVSAANSLIGSTGYDFVGSGGVTELTNGNYVVSSGSWDSGGVTDAGAVTFGNGSAGVVGAVSAANSLVGSTADDELGSGGVTVLTNGNYVVSSRYWDNGPGTNAGAVTFGNGNTGVFGEVSATNSLVGSTADDFVGYGGVTALTNGNYVVRSSYWDNGAATDAGAVTFGDGNTGVVGAVSAANSLVGTTASDLVGIYGVTVLANGNFVVISAEWDNGSISNAGAVTFGNGNTGVSGKVSATNSLVGSTADDFVGFGGVTALTNGNYVVNSELWGDSKGAVTFGNGSTGVVGAVSDTNSLVGTTASDRVGFYGVWALTNGNYVVSSPEWDNGAVTDAGAVTFGNGATGVTGTVSAANSLVGSTVYDRVGSGGVTALTNGNYVVGSYYWDNGNKYEAGAVTFGNGSTGVVGEVSAANSLVGSSENDFVGSDRVTALTNGNYVVSSPEWDNGAVTDAGAVTFGDGNTGVVGAVSAANSLVGSTADDHVGSDRVTALTNGNYVVSSPDWDNGPLVNGGAVTFGSGTMGVRGLLSAANSLVGSTADDRVGSGGVTALTNGNYVVVSPEWDKGFVIDAGAVTFGGGTRGVSGVVTVVNSVMGDAGGADIAIEVDDFNNTYSVIFKNEEQTYVRSQGEVIPPQTLHQFVDPSPSVNNGFGESIVTLSSGNVVITAPRDDAGGTDAGAVYLFDGATKALISTLLGSTSGDNVGSDGVTVLANGNFVVISPDWDNGSISNAGAVTFGNGNTGVSGKVTAINSLVGSKTDDRVGIYGVTALTNGNYVVSSYFWDNGPETNAGAVTYGNGNTGVFGEVSATNSLVGSTADDFVGSGGVTALTNGNYVVSSPDWDNGPLVNGGAVTFGNGTTGVVGAVSAANSLVGSTADDFVGFGGVTVLTNGNYVVRSSYWDNGAATDAGAVTFGDGNTGVVGAVSDTNSLVGSTAYEGVGSGGVRALTNGNYVVSSPYWDNGPGTNAGAVTFGNGNTGVFGEVSATNSLVGSTADDQVGYGGVTALTNGNYVVRSELWGDSKGAVTFGNGSTGVVGAVSDTNSLVGSTAYEGVGSGGVRALTNGNYVVNSPYWDNGAATEAGAVTFGNGATGVTGTVSAANSLVGSSAYDRVGSGGVTALTNGNYVVSSYNWDNGTATDAGAVTFGDGNTGVFGAVTAANSLVGSTADDRVGIDGVTALTNGNYVVRSSSWDNGAATDAGAVTFGDGNTGVFGAVTAANSLVGSTAFDRVGDGGVTALTNGNYVVRSYFWDNGAATDAGAVTFGNGNTGVFGAVTAANSLVGSTADDRVGTGGVTALTNGNYVVSSPEWDNGAVTDAGAVTFSNGATGVNGEMSETNSLTGVLDWDVYMSDLVGDNSNDTLFKVFLTEGKAQVLVQGDELPPLTLNEFIDPNSNPNEYNGFGETIVTLSTGNVVITAPYDDAAGIDAGAVYLFDGATRELISTIVGSTSGDNVGSGGVTALPNGNYVISSGSWDNGTATDVGAVTFGNGITGVSGVVSAANSLVGSSEYDQVGYSDYERSAVTALSNGNYVVSSAGWDNGLEYDAGAVTFGDGNTGVFGEVSAANSLVGSSENDQVGYSDYERSAVTALSNGNYVVSSSNWTNGLEYSAGAVTFGDGTTGVVGAVSDTNSLVGTTASDQVGSGGVTALTNGNYVVSSSNWTNGLEYGAGAVTFGNGTTGVVGAVSDTNSLVGTIASDQVGYDGVTALTNGNYVVGSSNWTNGLKYGAGAVTFGNGTKGVVGAVSDTNSLVGSTEYDFVGLDGVTALTNGNYVVGSSNWTNGLTYGAGAVTFGDGTTGVVGAVSDINSLVGSSEYDNVGSNGYESSAVTALSNGNYVVSSPQWDNGTDYDAGAVTFGNGSTGVSGVVSAANSLIGTTENDNLGLGGVTALTNGNYVVSSPYWDDDGMADVGAVTFGKGSTGVIGMVSDANSLIGSSEYDNVGYSDYERPAVTALSNGNYVVSSPHWDNGVENDVGAVTFGNGLTGVLGLISYTNSLFGSNTSDRVGYGGVTALTNGSYVVSSPDWDNGSISNAGAVTFGNGITGVMGAVTDSNSLVGSSEYDNVGYGDYENSAVTALSGGSYLINNIYWDNGAITTPGALTFGNGSTGVTGQLTSNNSVTGFEDELSEVEIIRDDISDTFIISFPYAGTVLVGSQSVGFPPATLDAISDDTIRANASTQLLNLSGIGASGFIGNNLRVTATSSNTGLIPDPVVAYTSLLAGHGCLTFTPVMDQNGVTTITVTVEDGGLDGDLSTTADNGLFQRTFDVTVDLLVDIDLRVVSTPTSLLPNGEVSQLPDNQNWVAEWSTFWVEIWVTTQYPDSEGIAKVALDLSYQTAYTSATEIEYGPAFTQNQSGTIDDLNGTVENVSAETEIADLGINSQLLFARIKFVPQVDDQVSLDVTGRSIGSHDLEIQMDSPVVDLGNAPNLIPVIAPNVDSSIWANPFDKNDDGTINFRDLMLFASVYGAKPSESSNDYSWFSDYNQDDRVNFRDLMLFASNYRKNKANDSDVYYPSNYPDAWDNPLLVSLQPQTETKTVSLTQVEADQVLEKAIEQVSEKLTPEMSQALSGVEVKIVDLSGRTLGRAVPGTIYLDVNAAGYGWFVDSTPLDHSEFALDSQLSLIALPDSDAAGRIDLWTVILHELGHLAGYEHESEGVMEETLAPGVRKLADWEETTDLFFASVKEEGELLPF